MKHTDRMFIRSSVDCGLAENVGRQRLDVYGELLFACRGTGRLFFSEERGWECQFEAGQLENGDCLLLCDFLKTLPPLSLHWEAPIRFVGKTEEGRTLTASHLSETNYLPETPKDQSGMFYALHARRFDLAEGASAEHEARFAIFGLSNLVLRGQAVSLPDCDGETVIYPIGEYRVREERLRTLKGVLVTAELEMTWHPDEGNLHQVVDDICYLLSLARGTKIQWIYQIDADINRRILRSSRFSRVTKKYTPLSLIDYRVPGSTESFLAKSIPTYRSRRQAWALDNLIDVYLDAKSESDILEMRGVKLAVAVEMLKASFIKATGHPEHLMEVKKFDKLIPALKEALKSVLGPVFDKDQRKSVYGHLKSLNRLQFRRVLWSLCQIIKFEVSEEDLSLFIESRDNLIHHGRFLSDRSNQVGVPKFGDSVEEYFWLAHFVDRLFLRLVNYDGAYLDWSTQPPVLRAGVSGLTKAGGECR